MSRRGVVWVAMLAMIGVVLPLGGRTLAQGPGRTLDRSRLRAPRPAIDGGARRSIGARGGPLARRNAQVTVLIELHDAPAVRVFADRQRGASPAAATTAARAQLARIERAQQELLPRLRRLGATVIYRTQRVLNGIAVRVPARELGRLRQLPGVKAVRPLAPRYRLNASSVPVIGAPAHCDRPDVNGAGPSITSATLETAIDYLHADFGGSARLAD